VADVAVARFFAPTDGVVAAVGRVSDSTLDSPADFTACALADFIFVGAADPLLGVTADSAFGVVTEEEIISVGNGNENIRISNLKKKDRNIRRIAVMR